jgi:chitin synthase
LLYTPLLSATPVDFAEKHEYSLYFNPRPHHQKDPSKKSSIRIRMFIVITMYNEKRDELKRTLTGIAENLKYLCEKLHIADFWKEVVVCIVSDGRTRANADTIDYLTEIGACSPSLIEKGLEKYGDEVSCHLFESTVKLVSNATMNEYHLPMQMMFALKERNGGKIDSHWWYFAGFAAVLNPDYCFVSSLIEFHY